jgi:hypothetical protein
VLEPSAHTRSQAIAARGPDRDSLTPDAVLLQLPPAQRVRIEQLHQNGALNLAGDVPDDLRTRSTSSGDTRQVTDAEKFTKANEGVSVVVSQIDLAEAAPACPIVGYYAKGGLGLEESCQPVRRRLIQSRGGGNPRSDFGFTAGSAGHSAISGVET